jgi:hypothetical protein
MNMSEFRSRVATFCEVMGRSAENWCGWPLSAMRALLCLLKNYISIHLKYPLGVPTTPLTLQLAHLGGQKKWVENRSM